MKITASQFMKGESLFKLTPITLSFFCGMLCLFLKIFAEMPFRIKRYEGGVQSINSQYKLNNIF